jgi:phosphoribosylformimino-5-aminoimidazole carboxamide ribotide isomerase
VVDELADAHPGRVAVGLDARGNEVAIHGWTTSTGLDLLTLAQRFARPGVGAVISTDIGRDGTMEGPAATAYGALLDAVDVPIVASGGVGTLDDLRALDPRLAGVIVGRAIYERRFTVEEGIAACSPSA